MNPEKNCRKLKFSGKFPKYPLYVIPKSPQKSPWCFSQKSKMAAENTIWNALVYMKAIYFCTIPLFLLIME